MVCALSALVIDKCYHCYTLTFCMTKPVDKGVKTWWDSPVNNRPYNVKKWNNCALKSAYSYTELATSVTTSVTRETCLLFKLLISSSIDLLHANLVSIFLHLLWMFMVWSSQASVKNTFLPQTSHVVGPWWLMLLCFSRAFLLLHLKLHSSQ